MSSEKKVVIIGAGLSGLAAGVILAEEGFPVTVLERRPSLGGRTTSHRIPHRSSEGEQQRTDSPDSTLEPPYSLELVDNCPHILMRCCNNLLDFCTKLGVHRQIKFYDRYLYLDEKGRLIKLGGSFLPAPFHLLPSFLAFKPLQWSEKWAVLRAFLAMMRLGPELSSLDHLTMWDWLKQQKQPVRSIELFWRPILVGALNEELEKASARYGLKVFIEGMLKRRRNFEMGVPSLPLLDLYSRPSVQFLESRRGCCLSRTTVAKLEIDQGRVTAALLADGTRITADYFISAVPAFSLRQILPAELLQKDASFSQLSQFEYSPITSIHLWFDRKFTHLPNLAFLGRKMHWLFAKESFSSHQSESQTFALSLLVSASRELIPLGKHEIVQMALHELHESIPASRQTVLIQSAVFKEPYATFSCAAGCDSYRLDQKTSLENFYVAGDWTDTGWPSTMEGAVRSGYRCAELLLAKEGIPRPVLLPELPAEGLAHWLVK
jgi:squalene-associated FAD-dependent desaturase